MFTEKLVGDESERAVSPVIGVILMVAITVILAAVIAAFVLDLGQGQSANPQAGYSTSEYTNDTDDTNVEVSLTSVERLDRLEFQGDCTDKTGDTNSAVQVDSGTHYVASGDISVGSSYQTGCSPDGFTIVGIYDGNEVVLN
ncbi:hypothetical protein C478_18507 [Natrinema thermotolerans DSM 11552]|nr:hypothetical protein C478_18507 [Natrinema thermotolerans DSM 11552]